MTIFRWGRINSRGGLTRWGLRALSRCILDPDGGLGNGRLADKEE